MGTPFFLFTDGAPARSTCSRTRTTRATSRPGSSAAITTSAATLNGSVNPGGARVRVHFDFGTTAAYGASTPDQPLGVASTPLLFSAALTGLPAGTTIHYRAVASSDFATITGADQTFTTAAATTTPPPPPPPVKNVPPKVTIVSVPHVVSLRHLGKGKLLKLKLRLSEPAKVTIALIGKKHRVVRSLTITRKQAGAFTVLLSLKHIAKRTYTLRIGAIDPQGARSLIVNRTLRVV